MHGVALTTGLNGLDRGQVDDLELFGLGETEGGKVFREPLDSMGCLQARGLIVGREVLYDLICNTLER